MSQSFTVHFDLKLLMAKLGALGKLTNKNLEALIDAQGKLLIDDRKTGVLSMTPPNSSEHRGTKAKKVGEAVVARDIMRVYQSASGIYAVLQVLDPNLANAFWKALKDGDEATALQIYRSRISLKGQPTIGTFDKSLHKKWRRKGRVIANYPKQIVTNPKALQKYIKERQGNVGILGSGMNKSAYHLRAQVPAWIKRHQGKRSTFRVAHPRGSGRYTLELGSSVGFQQREQQYRFRYAVQYRQNAMRRQLPYILKKAAKQAKLAA